MVNSGDYIFVQPHRMYNTKSEPNVNYGPWVIMMSQCRFIDYKKCTTLVRNINSGASCAWVGAGCIELSVLSTPFCCELKTSLKSKV